MQSCLPSDTLTVYGSIVSAIFQSTQFDDEIHKQKWAQNIIWLITNEKNNHIFDRKCCKNLSECAVTACALQMEGFFLDFDFIRYDTV